MLQKLFNPEWQITSKSFLLSSFLIGFSFSPTAEISRLELEFEESLPRKIASKRGLDRSQMEQPIKKSKFSYFADLAFSFVHKRSGNEIIHDHNCTKNSRHFLFLHFSTQSFSFFPILHRLATCQNAVSTMDDR